MPDNIFSKQARLEPRSYSVSSDESRYDEGFIVPQFGDRQAALYEYRAQQQPWYDKLTNSVVKGVGLAGTTFADTFAGSAAGLINMASTGAEILASDQDYDNYDATKQIFNAFVNNPVSVALNNFNEMLASDVLVNYRTKKEMDNSWYENAIGMGGLSGITNFWGEDVLKNAGFMAGAMYGGKGLASLGSKLLKLEEGRKEFKNLKQAAEKIMSGVDLPDNKTTTLINAFKNNPELYKLEAAKIMDDFAKAAASTRKKEFAIQAAASTLGSFGEARIEAIGNGNAYRQERERELNNAFKAGELTEQEYQQALGRIDKEVIAYQNSSFLANSLLLSGSNYMGLRNAYLRPYDYAIKNRVGEAVRITEGAEKGLYKYISPTKTQALGKSALNVLRESQEEQLQFAIDKTVGQWVRTNKNGDNVKSLFESISDGLSDAYGTEEGLENAFIGGLFGAIGFGGGGAISEYKDIMQRSKQEEEIVTNLNKLIKENKLEDKSLPLLKAVVKDLNLQAKQNKAIDNSDQYTYEETKDEKFFNIANAFIDAGKMEDLIDLYKEENELTADQLKLKYSYLKDPNDPNSRVSYFENRTDEEIKEYFREKTANAIGEVKKLRDLKDNLSTLYRNELIKVKNKEGEDMEIKVKDFLTEQFYMGEARDKRLLKLKNEILKYANNEKVNIELFEGNFDINEALRLIDEQLKNKFTQPFKTKEEQEKDIKEGKEVSKELKESLEKEDKKFNELIDILNKFDKATFKAELTEEGKIVRSKDSEQIGSLLSDYAKLLSERTLSNFYLAQLSNNNFSKLVQELKKAENEVAKEQEENEAYNLSNDDKYNRLMQQFRDAGYNSNSDKIYFKLKNKLNVSITGPDDNKTVKDVFTDEPLTVDNFNDKGEFVNSITPNILDKNFLVENFNNIEFVSVEDAENEIKKQQLSDNIQALTEATNEQVKIIKEKIDETNQQIEEWKQQKQDLITESNILLEDIKNTAYNRNYTEKRKQWKKQLKNLQNKVKEIDDKINKLNEFKSELQSQIDGLVSLKDNIEKLKTISDFTEISNILSDAILEKEIDAELIGKGLDTIEILDDIILQLEDEKRYIQKVVNQLEEILAASDTTIKSYFVVMDDTFKNKWVNEVGLTYLLNNNGKPTREDFIKNFPTIKRKLRQYSERVGITLKEAFDEFDIALNELEKIQKRYEDQYQLENLLITNKQDLEEVSKSLEDLYKRYDKAIENDVLYKKYNALSKNLESLNKLYVNILAKVYKSKKVDDTQLTSIPETEDGLIDIDLNILSSELFYTTNRDADKIKEDGVYEDVRNSDGLPKLNSNPAALAFMKFINTYFNDFNNSNINDNYTLQVFKYNPETAPKAVKDQIGDKTTDADYYVMLVNKKTNDFVYINSEGKLYGGTETEGKFPVFRFIPKTNNLLSIKNKSKVNKKGLYSFINKKNYTIESIENENDKTTYVLKNNTTNEEKSFNTESDLIDEVITIASKYHSEFIKKLDDQLVAGNKVYLNISGVNNGIAIDKIKDGELQYSDLYQILSSGRNVTIDNTGKLNGARIIVFSSNTVTLPNGKVVSGRPGQFLIYVDSTGEVIPSFTNYLSEDDIFTVLNLINSVKNFKNLSDVQYELPKGETVVKGDRESSQLNLFGVGAEYSIMNAITYWGKSKRGSVKDIFIDKGKIYFGNENLDLKDVLDFTKNKGLVDFLRTKKYNISQTHLVNRGPYYHPKFEDGKLKFDKYASYTDYLMTNGILSTPIANSNQNNYSENLLFFSRNFIFETNANGDPIISINKDFAEKPPVNKNPMAGGPRIDINGKTYVILDQFSPTNTESFEYEQIKDKYVGIIVQNDFHVFKVTEEGLLEPIQSKNNFENNKAFTKIFNEQLSTLESPNDRISSLINLLFVNNTTYLVEPIDIDINDQEEVEEKQKECEVGGKSSSEKSTEKSTEKDESNIENDIFGESNTGNKTDNTNNNSENPFGDW